MNEASTTGGQPVLPQAIVAPRSGWWWLIPAAALLITIALGYRAWLDRGVQVTITFLDGHGITVGDSIKHRGIVVGKVRRASLTEDGSAVRVTAALSRDAAVLAREGTMFWLVRPEIGLSRIAGLDTIVGARYIGVTPGDGAALFEFDGLETPPVVPRAETGDLEVIVECARRGSLAPGSPVVYRQVQIGTVVGVRLADDASMVEATVHIASRYAPLVRRDTRFWDIGGIEFVVGFTGVRASFESTELLLRGGLALATPRNAGPPAREGDRFRLDAEPRREWLDWQPDVRLVPGT